MNDTAQKLTHFDAHGQAHMVDVGEKNETRRVAQATGHITMNEAAFEQLSAGTAHKGDVLGVARIAAISASKQTSQLIPLCHPLSLSGCRVDITIEGDEAVIDCRVSCKGRTGVEMEALTGASVAALTIYDMCKAMSHDMVIREVRLMGKAGGKRDFQRIES